MWLSILGLILSIFAVCSCVWLFLEQSKKLSTEDLKSKLSESSAELSKTYAASVKQIEVEWDNMYEKFARLAGRMDRKKALEQPLIVAEVPQQEKTLRRSDLLRGRNK